MEAWVPGDPPTSFTDKAKIITRRYNMSDAWTRDVAACNPREMDVISRTVKSLARQLVDDLNRPNPNPELVRALADAARNYVAALDAITGGSRGLDAAVANVYRPLELVRAPLQPFSFEDASIGLRI